MSKPDNIEIASAGPETVDKVAKDKAAARARAAASRLAKKRSMPADQATFADTVLLCLLDLQTLPPSKRAARAEVIADVTRQTIRTLTAMGHPDVRESWMETVEAMAARLRTERWHHPLSHRPFRPPPVSTPVTGSARGASSTDRIAESTARTNSVRTE